MRRTPCIQRARRSAQGLAARMLRSHRGRQGSIHPEASTDAPASLSRIHVRRGRRFIEGPMTAAAVRLSPGGVCI